MEEDGTRKFPSLSTPDGKSTPSTDPDGKSARPGTGRRFAFVPLALYEDRRLKLTHHRVMGVILSYHNPRNPERGCWPSQEKIARHLGISSKLVSDTVRSLAALGYLEVMKKGRKNHYHIPENMNEKSTATTGVSCNSTVPTGVSAPVNSTATTVVSSRNSTVVTGVEHTIEEEEQTKNTETPLTPLVCGKEMKNTKGGDEEPESKTEPTPAEPSEHQAADEAWNSIAEPYEPTPAEPAPAAPAHTRIARTVPGNPKEVEISRGTYRPTRQATLPLPLEEESSDSRPTEPAPIPKPKRHTYNGARAKRFLDFWAVWRKKAAKLAAYKVWVAQDLDAMADEIIADVEQRQAAHGQWLRGYQPNPDRYLRNWQWEDEIVPDRPNGRVRPESDTDRYLRELNESIARGDAEERAAAGDFSGGDWFEGEVVARH